MTISWHTDDNFTLGRTQADKLLDDMISVVPALWPWVRVSTRRVQRSLVTSALESDGEVVGHEMESVQNLRHGGDGVEVKAIFVGSECGCKIKLLDIRFQHCFVHA